MVVFVHCSSVLVPVHCIHNAVKHWRRNKFESGRHMSVFFSEPLHFFKVPPKGGGEGAGCQHISTQMSFHISFLNRYNINTYYVKISPIDIDIIGQPSIAGRTSIIMANVCSSVTLSVCQLYDPHPCKLQLHWQADGEHDAIGQTETHSKSPNVFMGNEL